MTNPVRSDPVSGALPQACPETDGRTGAGEDALAHARYLADDALEGREAGSPGARCAADYIAGRFKAIGFRGAGPDCSYFQAFPVRAGSALGEPNELRIAQAGYPVDAEWIPLGDGASTAVSVPMIYGGDGINRPGDPDNPYPRLDLDGRVVVLEGGDLRRQSSRALQAQAPWIPMRSAPSTAERTTTPAARLD